MKKFLFAFIFISSQCLLLTKQAQAANACLERASDEEIIDELSRRLGHGGGGGGGQPIIVDSSVDQNCVSKLAQKFPYQPNEDNLISWAGQCRTIADDRCLLISSSANSSCLDLLLKLFPYQPSATNLENFGRACQSRRYSCRSL